jgi:hypothetical protein
LGIPSITLLGRPRKEVGWILPGYHFHNPFRLSEEGSRADSSLGIPSITLSGHLRKEVGRILPRYPFHNPFGLSEEGSQADSSLGIPSTTLSGRPRKEVGQILNLSIVLKMNWQNLCFINVKIVEK